MILVASVCVLFALFSLLIFIEDGIPTNYRKVIYWSACAILIILAGTRKVGLDPDSIEYEKSFLHPFSDNVFEQVEFTYVFIAQTFNYFTHDVHALFLVYALLGVTLKFIAFRRYGDSWLLMVFMYISFYYELHETCQIRAGVLSACMLLAVPYIADNQRWKAFLWIAVGTCFHLSGVILLPLLFLGSKPLGKTWKIALALSVPISYAIAGFNIALDFASEIPYIGGKLAFYTDIEEKGKIVLSSLNLFGALHLLLVFLFYYLLFFADAITEKCRYFPLMLKILAVALFSYALFSFIPVMGERMGSMYRTIMIVLIPTIVYTLRPKWCGVLFLVLIAFIFFNFSLRNMYNVTFFLPSAN